MAGGYCEAVKAVGAVEGAEGFYTSGVGVASVAVEEAEGAADFVVAEAVEVDDEDRVSAVCSVSVGSSIHRRCTEASMRSTARFSRIYKGGNFRHRIRLPKLRSYTTVDAFSAVVAAAVEAFADVDAMEVRSAAFLPRSGSSKVPTRSDSGSCTT